VKRNRYRRALEILKSTDVDKKRNSINEALPTNHTKGVYSLNDPGFRLGEKDPAKVYYPDVDGNWPEGIPGTPGETEYVRPAGYWSGGSDWGETLSPDFSQDYLKNDPTGRSTTGLIKPDGTVMTLLPPGGENFILGPLVDGFVPNHTYDAYTNIGYLQKDTRQFVLLARISGVWKDGIHDGNYSVWNGTSTGLTIYNENFTLEMAQWMKDQIDQGKWIDNVPYFYSGGVPQVPQSPADCPFCPPNTFGGFGFGGGGLLGALLDLLKFGQGTEPTLGTQQAAPKSGDAKDAGFPWDVIGQLGSYVTDNLNNVYNFLSDVVGANAVVVVNGIVDGMIGLESAFSASMKAWNNGNVIKDPSSMTGYSIKPGVEGSKENPVKTILSATTSASVSEGVNSNMSSVELKNQIASNLINNFNIGSRGTIGSLTDKTEGPYFDEEKNLVIPETYSFNEQGTVSDRPAGFFGTVGDVAKALSFGNQEIEKEILTIFDKSIGVAVPLTYALDRDDPVVYQNFIIPASQIKDSYEPTGTTLTESRKRILREIKKPYKLPEVPKQKYKMNFSGKFSPQNTPDKTSSKLSDDLVASGNAKGQRWRVQDKYWQGYETTERMNVIYDRVGHGNQYWEEIVNENKRKNSWKTKEIQEHLNIMAHEKAMKEENPNYESPFYKEFIEEQETLQADNDPLFKKIADRLKKEIDYPDKPSKNGVPNEAPPEMINGYHPKFGKRKDYYKKLDPVSARSMPKTGDLEIDSQIDAAKNKPK